MAERLSALVIDEPVSRSSAPPQEVLSTLSVAAERRAQAGVADSLEEYASGGPLHSEDDVIAYLAARR